MHLQLVLKQDHEYLFHEYLIIIGTANFFLKIDFHIAKAPIKQRYSPGEGGIEEQLSVW